MNLKDDISCSNPRSAYQWTTDAFFMRRWLGSWNLFRDGPCIDQQGQVARYALNFCWLYLLGNIPLSCQSSLYLRSNRLLVSNPTSAIHDGRNFELRPHNSGGEPTHTENYNWLEPCVDLRDSHYDEFRILSLALLDFQVLKEVP
jgi:hypothetical protein